VEGAGAADTWRPNSGCFRGSLQLHSRKLSAATKVPPNHPSRSNELVKVDHPIESRIELSIWLAVILSKEISGMPLYLVFREILQSSIWILRSPNLEVAHSPKFLYERINE
jgi:hypothetical protein